MLTTAHGVCVCVCVIRATPTARCSFTIRATHVEFQSFVNAFGHSNESRDVLPGMLLFSPHLGPNARNSNENRPPKPDIIKLPQKHAKEKTKDVATHGGINSRPAADRTTSCI